MIYQYFPDLCRQISARYTNYRRASYLQAVKECCQEVQKAVRELYNQGKHPTEMLVCEIIPQPGYFRYKQVRQALKEAQHRKVILPVTAILKK
jgi:hypothetical protein